MKKLELIDRKSEEQLLGGWHRITTNTLVKIIRMLILRHNKMACVVNELIDERNKSKK